VVTAYVTPADASLNTTATAIATATAASTAANTTFPAACTFNSSLPIENVRKVAILSTGFLRDSVKWFFGLFIPVWIERIWNFFEIFWSVINQGRARFCSFGAVRECAKHVSAPSPTAHNAFFLTS
jgi:hypothetical protein